MSGTTRSRPAAGSVALSATAGTIGSTLHRLSVVSGVGVTQAGDIVLNAGQDIFLDNVTLTSVAAGGGARKAIFQAHAGHGIAVAGAIALEASATGIGALASAEAELFANGAITVNGQVSVLANAHGAGGSVEANAGLIAAASHSVIGNSIRTGAASSIHFAHGVDVEAKAVSDNSGAPIKADARARGLLAAGRVEVDGPATVKATASGSDLHPVAANGLSSGDIRASATLTAEDGTLDFAHGYYHRHVAARNVIFGSLIDVEAKALGGSNFIDLRGAFASAALYGNDIAVHGEATVGPRSKTRPRPGTAGPSSTSRRRIWSLPAPPTARASGATCMTSRPAASPSSRGSRSRPTPMAARSARPPTRSPSPRLPAMTSRSAAASP